MTNIFQFLAQVTLPRRVGWFFMMVVIWGCRADQSIKPIFTLDLHRYGYHSAGHETLDDYSEMAFLSDDALVVSVNQRSDESPMLADTDLPTSEVLVLDLKTKSVARSRRLRMRKSAGSLFAISGERIAVLTADGFHLCSRDLLCGQTIQGVGPLLVSPKGNSIAFGGDGMTRRVIFDVESLREMNFFEDSRFTEFGGGVIPGDDAVLICRAATSFDILQPRKNEKSIQFSRGGDFMKSRFLNDNMIVFLDHASSVAVVSDLDGRQLYRNQLEKVYRTSFLTTSAGTRFGIYEYNLPGIEETGPNHFQRVRVIDSESGKEVAKIQWDLESDAIRRPVTPQLSPSGHLLARVRKGIVELLQIN